MAWLGGLPKKPMLGVAPDTLTWAFSKRRSGVSRLLRSENAVGNEFLFSGRAGVLMQRVVPCPESVSLGHPTHTPSQETGANDNGSLGEEPCAVNIASTALKRRRGK